MVSGRARVLREAQKRPPKVWLRARHSWEMKEGERSGLKVARSSCKRERGASDAHPQPQIFHDMRVDQAFLDKSLSFWDIWLKLA